ncbi:hypothetical protein BRADI_2g20612v3 [Brachypodium distachyon]|uniref:RING-type E3 ubiquitin transferase n=1 Tax=Brachypodium distachyon TaxID=15368 RepID=A0A0Q3II63_BRADI|nr:hypothetical protein BRADI_2g20612v3 [Brachypodium distachyon]
MDSLKGDLNGFDDYEYDDGDSESDAAEVYDSESDDGEVDVPLKVDHSHPHAAMARRTIRPLVRRFSVLYGLFHERALRFAMAANTAGCLRVHYAEHEEEQGEQQRSTILLLNRYTVFDVELGDLVPRRRGGSAALGPLVYPAVNAGPLQELWASWAANVRVPPRAARIHLLADIAILPRRCYTPALMHLVCCSRTLLGRMMAEPWRGYHVAMELQLPEPVVLRRPCQDEGKEKEKGKEKCPVCLEELESGLVRWPGCLQPHVFHGECLELSLKESDKCPVCRRRLADPIYG